MATTSAPPDNSAAPSLDSEIFDDEATIARSGGIAQLLRLWNSLVRAEVGSVQSFPVYDREAKLQQRWHQWLVGIAAFAGSVAVLLAILQLAALARPELLGKFLVNLLAKCEYFAAALALLAVVLGLAVAFHTRWQLLRMKAEQYRFIKFHFLLHAGSWVNRSEHEQKERLQTLLAGLHALDGHDAHEWAQGVFSLVDDDPAIIAQADGPLTDDMVRYFREKRIGSQRDYFSGQARKRRENERQTWVIPPACFFLSILCALLHFGVEILFHPAHEATVDAKGGVAVGVAAASPTDHAKPGTKTTDAEAHPEPPPSPLMLACLIGAAAFPVLGAMVRTMRTAFEFGRNANRFEGMTRILTDVELQLQLAPTAPVKLELLRESEFVLRHENRSWMRLMIEAEWFG